MEGSRRDEAVQLLLPCMARYRRRIDTEDESLDKGWECAM